MEISDDILCLFSAELSTRDGSYVIEVPEQELPLGEAETEVPYRIAIIPQMITQSDAESTKQPRQSEGRSDPPVSVSEHRIVEIEDIGEQGDGIARVERGYVVIVLNADLNERVEVEITSVRANVAFAEVINRPRNNR